DPKTFTCIRPSGGSHFLPTIASLKRDQHSFVSLHEQVRAAGDDEGEDFIAVSAAPATEGMGGLQTTEQAPVQATATGDEGRVDAASEELGLDKGA
ncbi:hypothetical protein LTR04_006872, partial [Oleoguttula sp. CCFEE 6159]